MKKHKGDVKSDSATRQTPMPKKPVITSGSGSANPKGKKSGGY